jgi:hypothetical protein
MRLGLEKGSAEGWGGGGGGSLAVHCSGCGGNYDQM